MPLEAPTSHTRRPRQSVMGGFMGLNSVKPRVAGATVAAGIGDSTKARGVLMVRASRKTA